jgi:nucleoside-diphosphate-sugar epimerase
MTGVAVCALRPTFVYGPRQNWNLITYVQQCARRGVPVCLQGGSQTRDLLYVDDVVRAFVAAAARRSAWGRAIPVGGGREIPVSTLCQEILKVLGSDVEIQVGSNAPRMTEIWRSFCDNAEAEQWLHWAPVVALDEGMEQTLVAAPQALRQAAVSAG